jgi:membrane-bound ClpP family serine protease
VFRLISAIVTTAMEEVAIAFLWLKGLPALGVNLPVLPLIIIMAGWAIWAVTGFMLGSRALRKPLFPGLHTMVGTTGKVVQALTPKGTVSIRGELWSAQAVEGRVEVGAEVRVVGQEGLKLLVAAEPKR